MICALRPTFMKSTPGLEIGFKIITCNDVSPILNNPELRRNPTEPKIDQLKHRESQLEQFAKKYDKQIFSISPNLLTYNFYPIYIHSMQYQGPLDLQFNALPT